MFVIGAAKSGIFLCYAHEDLPGTKLLKELLTGEPLQKMLKRFFRRDCPLLLLMEAVLKGQPLFFSENKIAG